jgi:hypothetical protein
LLGRGPVAIESELEQPLGTVDGFCRLDRIDEERGPA